MRAKRPRTSRCWSTNTSSPMKPSPGAISWPSATPCLRVASTVFGSSNMVLLMMAAPALEPAITPPPRYIVPQRVEHQRIAAVGTAQRARDAALVAAGEIGAAGLAHRRRQFRVVGRGQVIGAGQLDRDRDEEGVGAVLVEQVHVEFGGRFGIGGGRCEHRDAGALAAGQAHDALPHHGVVGAQRAADDHQRTFRRGRLRPPARMPRQPSSAAARHGTGS